jgi:GNAT superfamily N-acetyltransferase
MYLEDLIVSEDMRGNKIGSLLFDALIKEAKSKNFVGMNWQALDWNEPALNFYRKYNASFDPEWVNCALDF